MTDTTQATPTIRQRVSSGVAWLDEHVADWWRPGWVKLTTLDMARPCRCVLGQLYGDYYDAPITLEQATDLGFDATDDAPLGESLATEWDALAAEWTQVIEVRRATEAARIAAACCPCRDAVCDAGCTCPNRQCPKTETEVTDE